MTFPIVAREATRPPTLSVCMIVRNEESMLSGALESLLSLAAEELIVVDTGSSDRTRSVAERFGARVFDFVWCDDFAAARNFSFARASGDWLLWWDADFRLAPGSAPLIRSFMQLTGYDAASFLHHEAPNDRVSLEAVLSGEEAAAASHCGAMQLLRRSASPSWAGHVHEGLLGWATSQASIRGLPRIDVQLPVDVVHSGWSRLRIPEKVARYRRLLRQRLLDDPHDVTAHHFLMMDAMEAGDVGEAERWLHAARDLPSSTHGHSAFFALSVYGAALHLNTGRPEQALDWIDWGVRAYGRHATLSFLQGCARQRTKHPEAARSYYEAIAAGGRWQPWDYERHYWAIPGAGAWRSWLSLAGYHLTQGDFALASVAANRALEDGGAESAEAAEIRGLRHAADELRARSWRAAPSAVTDGPSLTVCVLSGGDDAPVTAAVLTAVLADLAELEPEEILLLTPATGDPSPALPETSTRIEWCHLPTQLGQALVLELALARARSDWVLVWDARERLAPGNAAIVRAFIGSASADVGIVRRHYATRVDAAADDVVRGTEKQGRAQDAAILLRRASQPRCAAGPLASIEIEQWERAGDGPRLVEAELAVDIVSYARALTDAAAPAPLHRQLQTESTLEEVSVCAATALEAFLAGDVATARQCVEAFHSRPLHMGAGRVEYFVLAVLYAESCLTLGDQNAASLAVAWGERAYGEHRVLSFLRGRALELQGQLTEALGSYYRAIVLGYGHDCPRRLWWLSPNDEISGWLGWMKIASCYERLGEPALALSAACKASRTGGLQGPSARELGSMRERLNATVHGTCSDARGATAPRESAPVAASSDAGKVAASYAASGGRDQLRE